MRQFFVQRWRLWGVKLGFERDWYLIFVAGVIGLGMGTIAVAFITPLHWLETGAEKVPRDMMLWLVPTVPVLGALLAGTVYHFIAASGVGPAVTSVMYNIHRHRSRVPPRVFVRKWLAASLTIGSGGSAGAEGPIVTLGSAMGSMIGRLLRTSPQNSATLLGCGAAAGLASVFNAPIAGVFFVLEILLRDFSMRTLTPIVVASVVATSWSRGFLGNETMFTVSHDFLVMTTQFSLLELPNYILLGALCGTAVAVFIRLYYFTHRQFHRIKVHPIIRPAIGASLLGLAGLAYMLLVADDRTLPAFFGNGYPVVKSILDPSFYGLDGDGGLKPAAAVLILLVSWGALKAIATCLTLGSGGAGGFFAPSLMMGASLGGTMGYIVNALGWFPAANPATYALVGMAAMVAAMIHAPLTAILIVYEITGSYEIILPLMLAAVISTIVGRLLYRESVYTVKLTEAGIRVGAMSDLTILRRLMVQNVPLIPAVVVNADDSAQRLVELSEEQSVSDFVVIDKQGGYIGLVTAADLQAALVYRESIPLLQVNELVRNDLPTATPNDQLDVVLDKFSRHDVQSLAVLSDEAGNGVIRGLINRSNLMAVYQNALSQD